MEIKQSLLVEHLLNLAASLNLSFITIEAHKLAIEYELSCDDKDFVTFHKGKQVPFICEKLLVCDYQTTARPVYKDWYMSINYHS